MVHHKTFFLLVLLLAGWGAPAKCPSELKGASRARLEAAASSLVDAPLAANSLRYCVLFEVGTAHIATVTASQDDGSETWTGVTCLGQHRGHGKWECSAQRFRGISVIVARDLRDERITIGESTDPVWARRVIQEALTQLAGPGDLSNCIEGRNPASASLESVRSGLDRYETPLELEVMGSEIQLRRGIAKVRFELSPEGVSSPRLKCFVPGTVPRN